MTINIRVQTSPSKNAIDLEGKIDTSKREHIEHLVEMIITSCLCVFPITCRHIPLYPLLCNRVQQCLLDMQSPSVHIILHCS